MALVAYRSVGVKSVFVFCLFRKGLIDAGGRRAYDRSPEELHGRCKYAALYKLLGRAKTYTRLFFIHGRGVYFRAWLIVEKFTE